MAKLTETIQNGWPKHKKRSPKDVRQYWAVKSELSTDDGLIFKGEDIVIPRGLRKEVQSPIHQGHLRMERSKLRARELVYWPGLSKQIEDVVCSCAVCQELRHSNAREQMVPHEIPQYLWQVTGKHTLGTLRSNNADVTKVDQKLKYQNDYQSA